VVFERWRAGDHLVQQHGDGEEIGTPVDDAAENLFGRHVARRADDHAGERDRRAALLHRRIVRRKFRRLQLARETEIEKLHAVAGEENVRWFEIAMDEAARVQRLDRKSTRLNSSHLGISYAVFCLKKKTK